MIKSMTATQVKLSRKLKTPDQ